MKAPAAPICPTCTAPPPARLTTGREVYPHRRDLHDKPIWKCDGCGGYVGCHPGTNNPLGTPADYKLRQARMALHNSMIDPLWEGADTCGIYAPENEKAARKIRGTARKRVYAYLGAQLGIEVDQVHVGMFDLETCRRAWVALRGKTYADIRDWAKAQREAA
jgi:hypothetical protein